MSLVYIFSVLSNTLISVQAEDVYPTSKTMSADVYPCNIKTQYPPTVFAPTDNWSTPPFPTYDPTTTPPSPDSVVVLVGGAGPHQGNVMVNYNGDYGAILSCSSSAYDCYGVGTWSCAEAQVLCF